jgi:hypothetical protein
MAIAVAALATNQEINTPAMQGHTNFNKILSYYTLHAQYVSNNTLNDVILVIRNNACGYSTACQN